MPWINPVVGQNHADGQDNCQAVGNRQGNIRQSFAAVETSQQGRIKVGLISKRMHF